MQTEQPSLFTLEDKYIPPLIEVLEKATPEPLAIPQSSGTPKTLVTSLDQLFPEQQYQEKSIQKTKEILGSLEKLLTPEQLKEIVTEIQFLTDSWLDDFERELFEGQTLQELLHERTSV